MSELSCGKRKAPAQEPEECTEHNKQARLDVVPEHVRVELANGQNFVRWLEAEWTCPITYVLFVDPVEAEDGTHYERAAIEAYFATQPDGPSCLSPVKRTPMGKRLIPATWLAGAIAKMVSSGLVDDENATAWRELKQQQQDKAAIAALTSEALAGDTRAMRRLAFSYRDGKHGAKRDRKEAFTWFQKAADLKDASATAQCGIFYQKAWGVKRNFLRGIGALSIAATLGSETACWRLAQANELGLDGFEKHPADATKWYKEMVTCACLDLAEATGTPSRAKPLRRHAEEWLRKHAAEWLREHRSPGAE